jgi:plasmid stability protein
MGRNYCGYPQIWSALRVDIYKEPLRGTLNRPPPACYPRLCSLAGSACTAYNNCMQYTIRGIPPALHEALRERARASGKSLNEAAVDALTAGSGLTALRSRRRSLSDIAGTWRAEKTVEAALASQDVVDKDMWK